MKKILGCIVLCVAMVFAFCACSASSGSSSDDLQYKWLESTSMSDKEKLAFMVAKEITIAKMQGSDSLSEYTGVRTVEFFDAIYNEMLEKLTTK